MDEDRYEDLRLDIDELKAGRRVRSVLRRIAREIARGSQDDALRAEVTRLANAVGQHTDRVTKRIADLEETLNGVDAERQALAERLEVLSDGIDTVYSAVFGDGGATGDIPDDAGEAADPGDKV